MSVDDRLKATFQRVAATSVADLNATRDTLRPRMRSRRRPATIALAAAAVAVIAISAQVLRMSHDNSIDRPGSGLLHVQKRFPYDALSLRDPLAIAAAPDGGFYVSDRSDQISRYTSSGSLVTSWGSRGAAPEQLRLVSGDMAVGPQGRVYVADTGNTRIDVFTADGHFLTSYGRFGRSMGQYLWPTDVEIDNQGNIYVADQRWRTITMLDPEGKPVWRVARGRLPALATASVHLGQAGADDGVLAVNEVTGAVTHVSANGDLSAVSPTASGIHAAAGFCSVGQTPNGTLMISTCPTAGGRSRVFASDSQHSTWSEVGPQTVPNFDISGSAWALEPSSVINIRPRD